MFKVLADFMKKFFHHQAIQRNISIFPTTSAVTGSVNKLARQQQKIFNNIRGRGSQFEEQATGQQVAAGKAGGGSIVLLLAIDDLESQQVNIIIFHSIHW
jgi:hypothetical protein